LPSYAVFAQELYQTGVLNDAWLDGMPRFRLQGMLLTPAQAQRLRRAAVRVGAIYQELVQLVWEHPQWLNEFFCLTPYQKLMWFSAQGRWHGIARADLFLCANGRVQCCEVNSDTPSGEAEAVLINRLLHPYHGAVHDPNRHFPTAFWRMVCASHGGTPPRTIGIIYPTEFTEDLSMIAMYREWFEARGCQVILGSPYNVHPCQEGLGLFGTPIDLIVRHYKTDWWGERQPVWQDAAPYPDAEPLVGPLRLLLEAEYTGRITVVNPFGTVVTQNKRSLALMWEAFDTFSAPAQRWIRQYIPATYRLEHLAPEELLQHQHAWVLKSAYGCEGEETICGPFVSPEVWRHSVQHAIPQQWVCQRFFQAQPEAQGLVCNYGVYLVGGQSAGFFSRLAATATNVHAVTAPTFVAKRN
jgi:hypothetical protein